MKEYLETYYDLFGIPPHILWECPKSGSIVTIDLNIKYLKEMTEAEFDKLLIEIQKHLEDSKIIKIKKNGKKKT